LKEELLTAGFTSRHAAAESQTLEPGDTPRYGAGANIENHPQVTDFVPRRYRALGSLLLLGIAAGGVAELAMQYAQPLSQILPQISAEEITRIFCHRLQAWTSALVLLATAIYACLIYSLRRHRIDDTRGRYRVWRLAAWVAVVMSLNAVVGWHEPVARLLGSLTGWQAPINDAFWWLIPTALIGGWLLAQLIRDAAECRLALLAYSSAGGCFLVAAGGSVGWSLPWWDSAGGDVASRTALLAAHLLLLLGTLLYARYVVLDVQGLIEHRKSEQKEPSAPPAAESQLPAATPDETSSGSDQWVDGSQPELYQESGTSQRLSKSERKRLRKQKNRKRVA
jgi:hypothetical protein